MPPPLSKGKEREKERVDAGEDATVAIAESASEAAQPALELMEPASASELHLRSTAGVQQDEVGSGSNPSRAKEITRMYVTTRDLQGHLSKSEIKAGNKWIRDMDRLSRLTNWYTTSTSETRPLAHRAIKLKNSVGLFYQRWTFGRMLPGLRAHVHIRLAQAMADFGLQCRQIRESKEEHGALLQLIRDHLDKMIDFAGKAVKEEQDNLDDHQAYLLKCLRIQSLTFQDKQEEARSRLDALLDDVDWLEGLDEVEELDVSPTAMEQSHPRLVALASALGSVLQVTLNRSTGLVAKSELAQETMDWMLKHPSLYRFNSLHFPDQLFRFEVLTSVLRGPLQYIESRLPAWGKAAVAMMASSVCRCWLRQDAILPSYEIYRWAMGAEVILDESVIRLLLRLATLQKESLIAARMVGTLLNRARNGDRVLDLSTCRTMAYSCARRLDEDKMEELLRIIDTQYDQHEEQGQLFAFEARLLFYSRKGDMERAMRLVEARFDMHIAPGQHPEQGLLYPTYEVHARLVQTYIRANDRDEAETMLHRMAQFGHRPKAQLLNHILDYYARIDDLSSTIALYRQMKSSDFRINARACASIVALFAKRKDATSALRVVEKMQRDGLTPDRAVWNALLNAYVESGDWKAAVDLFCWMQKNHKRHLQPSSHTYNTMMKAHVLQAIPVQDVFAFFKETMAAGVDPDAYTLSLVLQSVVDAGLLDLAEQVFSSIEDRLGDMEGRPAGKGAGVWHFTIMIQGYLRANQIETAREYANELRERGLTATGVLWSVLVKAYAAREDDEELATSRNLVQSASFANPKEYVGAYQPLIEMYSKRASIDQVETLLQELADKEADIPLHLWTALMDSFRRQDNLAGTLEIWNLIFDNALEGLKFTDYIDGDGASPGAIKGDKASRSNMLCLPLSILIDMLASRGHHDKIAEEWMRCRKAGFAFDSHNWNHLCQACIRAGRLVDSLNIITRVLPNDPPSSAWRQLELATPDALQQSFKPTFSTEGIEVTDSPSRPPNRRHQDRVRDDVDAQYPLEEEDEKRRIRRDEAIGALSLELQPKEQKEVQGQRTRTTDSVAPPSMMRYLEEHAKRDEFLSPYFPHFATLTALDKALDGIERSGGTIEIEGKTSGLQEVMSTYPRVEALLANFRERISVLQEYARRDAVPR